MKTLKVLLPLAALAVSGIAAAGTRDNPSIVVRYGDLDLQSPKGVVSLYRRIRNAAESVCGQIETTAVGLRRGYRLCIAESIADAVVKVGHESLTNLHASRTRGAAAASS